MSWIFSVNCLFDMEPDLLWRSIFDYVLRPVLDRMFLWIPFLFFLSPLDGCDNGNTISLICFFYFPEMYNIWLDWIYILCEDDLFLIIANLFTFHFVLQIKVNYLCIYVKESLINQYFLNWKVLSKSTDWKIKRLTTNQCPYISLSEVAWSPHSWSPSNDKTNTFRKLLVNRLASLQSYASSKLRPTHPPVPRIFSGTKFFRYHQKNEKFPVPVRHTLV